LRSSSLNRKPTSPSTSWRNASPLLPGNPTLLRGISHLLPGNPTLLPERSSSLLGNPTLQGRASPGKEEEGALAPGVTNRNKSPEISRNSQTRHSTLNRTGFPRPQSITGVNTAQHFPPENFVKPLC